jgi:hypothetical protein
MTASPPIAVISLLLALATAGAVLAGDSAIVTFDEVIARNTEAMGGSAAIEAIQSVEVSLHITDQASRSWRLSRSATGRMRIDITGRWQRGVYMELMATPAVEPGRRKGRRHSQRCLRHGVEFQEIFWSARVAEARPSRRAKRARANRWRGYVPYVTFVDGYETSLWSIRRRGASRGDVMCALYIRMSTRRRRR